MNVVLPLRGPWLVIALRINNGCTTISALKARAAHSTERGQVRGNVKSMIKHGFIARADDGTLSVTEKGRSLL